MSELEQLLSGDGAAAPPAFILEGLAAEQASRKVAGSPRTIYEELWHISYWQQISLDWISGVETPYPAHAEEGFPSESDRKTFGRQSESWERLCERFFHGNEQAAAAARETAKLETSIRCTSRPGHPVRTMTVREQLENLAAHNAYHFGRVVLLRQMLGAWPPPSGGFSW
jgi:uncharacterized damage-inducible protein DinB